MNMSPDEFPKNVLKWIVSREEPMLIMLVPRPAAMMFLTEDDPEIIKDMYDAYLEIQRKKRKENQ